MGFSRYKSVLSLKNQLLAYFIFVALVPVCIVSVYYYHSTKSILKRDIGESNYKVISHIMDNIDKKVEQANELTDWIYTDKDISGLLKRPCSEVNIYDTNKKQAIENIARQFQYRPVTSYVLSLFIIGRNGLDIRNGTEAALISPESFTGSDWFLKGKEVNGEIFWGNISKNYAEISYNKYVIPQYRTIKDLGNGEILGYSVILFDQSIFSDCYKEVLLNRGEKIYLTDGLGNIISTNQSLEIDTNISNMQYFREIMRDENRRFFEENIDNNLNLITYKKSSKTGWILMEIIPMTQIQNQKSIIEKTAVVLIVCVILMCIFLSLFLSGNFTRPIKMIVKQVNEIAQGNFDRPISLNVSSEIDELGKSITKMTTDIKNLIQESVQKEKEKRTAEMKMLQSQINPHFLYNTLSSIKLMAAMQGAKGIEKMTVSLGRLLKAALGDLNEKISLREEISILEDYIHIQKIRYKGKIQFRKNIEDEGLLDCAIIKFILQPIVENSILHGIGPKDEEGEIILSVCREGSKLVVSVRDNGIGMSDEKMISLKKNSSTGNISYKGRGIGLSNINRRIKLVYGDEYGLNFESKTGEYTEVAVVLPVETA